MTKNGMNILYFTGAGASCQVLPLVSDFVSRLRQFSGAIRHLASRTATGLAGPENLKEEEKELLDAVEWLIPHAEKHASVDTFAKKLFFLNDLKELRKLKAVLSTFFVFEQARQNVDKRYDSFLASVLKIDSKNELTIPENLKILTWNYDTQWEKAFYGFCKDKTRVIDYITFGNRLNRLNGYCGTFPDGKLGAAFFSMWETDEDKALQHAIRLYKEYMTAGLPEPNIRFAWEDTTQTLFRKMQIDWQSINILIIIGYSFPYFNREVDRGILKSLSNLQEVYLQYPEGIHDSIEERMLSSGLKFSSSSRRNNIIKITATDLFFIPDAL